MVNIEEANGRRILTTKWVFTIKEDGRYRARLVVRGGEQEKESFDYENIYSPVVNNNSLRVLIAIAASRNYHITKFDIETAFLHGELQEDIYMYLSEGYRQETGKICKLKKTLYGLKQASIQWNKKFTGILKRKGLKQLSGERCLFKKEKSTLTLSLRKT